MLPAWMILAAVMGQTTQPATEIARPAPRITVSGAPARAAEPADEPVRPMPRPTAAPAVRALPVPTSQPAAELLGGIGTLSTDPIEVHATSTDEIIISGSEGDLAVLSKLIELMDQQPPGAEQTVEIFSLQSAPAADVAPNIQRLWNEYKKSASGQLHPEDRLIIIPDTRTNVLMVATAVDNMAQIREIVEKLDKPSISGEVQFTPIQLVHIQAAEAEQILQDMLKKIQTIRQAGKDLFTIQVVTRTNTLLIAAPEQDLEQIRALIDLIDVPPTPESGAVVKVEIVPLEKAVARELADALNDMLQTDMDVSQAMEERVRQLTISMRMPDGTEKPLKDMVNLEKPIKVFAEPGVNAIVIATVQENLEPLVEMVRLLDSVPLADDIMIKVFRLQYADAETLRSDLSNIFDAGKQLPRQPGKEVSGKIPPGVEGAALAYDIGLSSDKRTNALVVSGRAEQLILVGEIVEAVDVEEHANRFPVRMIKLEHADVRRIKDVADQLADQRAEMAKRLGDMAQERERVLIVEDVRTNSLIIVAKDDNYNEIVDLAKKLDDADEDWLGDIRIINLGKERLAASDIADKIESLWERRAQLRQEGGLPPDKPVIVTDSRSNALVVASNKEDFAAIERLVQQLQQQPLSPMMGIHHVILKHNDAAKMSGMLEELFEARIKNSLGQGEEEQPSDRVSIVDDPLTNTMLIVSSPSNYQEILSLLTQLDVPPGVEGAVRTFPVQHADVSDAADLIREMFDKGIIRGAAGDRDLPESLTKVTIVPDVRSSMLIVSASPENYAIVERLLTEIDRIEAPLLPAEARFFQIHHADAVNLGDILQQMLEGMRDSLGGDAGDQLQFQIVPEIRSNRLIVVGTRFAVRRAEELVEKLDVEPLFPSSTVEVYALKDASASQLESIMTELFEERASQDAQGKRTPIKIIADDASNSLLVTASQDDHRDVTELLKLLDKPSSVAQRMEIIPLKEAKPEQLAQTLTELIEAQQKNREEAFAVTPEPRTGSLVIWAAPDLLANIREIVEKLDNTRTKTQLAFQVFQLSNAKAEDLADLLDQFFENAGTGNRDEARQLIIDFIAAVNPDTGEAVVETLVHQDITIQPDPYTNSLLVMAPKEHIKMMGKLVEMLDRIEPQTAEIEVFELHNADAQDMKDLLDDLFQTDGGGSDEERVQFVLAGGGAAGLGTGGLGVEISFSVDERTNSLIVAGSPSYIKTVGSLVYRLDRRDIDERMVRVQRLHHRKASEVAETMQNYFEEESGLLEQAIGQEAAARQLARQVTVLADDQEETESSTLLVAYSPRMQSEVIRLINELDQPIPQVMIQVLMAEVTLTDRFELGMEFALQDLLFSEKAVVGANGITKGPDFDTIFGTDIGAAGSGTLGGLSFTVTGEDFNFLLRALQTEGRVEVLSRPSIMVQDGQEAEMIVGENIPTVTDLNFSASGVVTPSVDYQDVGIKLRVLPIINPDGFVNMEIEPEISALAQSSVSIGAGVTLPIITERRATTYVTVKDGETIIIGGLITSRENDSEIKVPLAGDIPILGNLFRSTVRETTKTELLIVLTPHVMRTEEDGRAISVEMRDSTGLIDNIRRSPLMQRLQVTPDGDQFGPIDWDPSPEGTKLTPDLGEEQGPELEEQGPAASAIRSRPVEQALVVKPG